MSLIAVVRIKGPINTSKPVRDTLEYLRLNKVNHAVVCKESPTLKGMLKKVEHIVSYGPIEETTLRDLVLKRGRKQGDKKVEEGEAEKIAKALIKGEKALEAGIKPVFRLSPPKKGHERKGIKKHYKEGGALGNRGKEINSLIKKML